MRERLADVLLDISDHAREVLSPRDESAVLLENIVCRDARAVLGIHHGNYILEDVHQLQLLPIRGGHQPRPRGDLISGKSVEIPGPLV